MRRLSHSKGVGFHLRPRHLQEELALVVHQELKGTVNTCNTNKKTQSLTVACTQKFQESVLDHRELFNVRQGPPLGSRCLINTVMEAKASSVQC